MRDSDGEYGRVPGFTHQCRTAFYECSIAANVTLTTHSYLCHSTQVRARDRNFTDVVLVPVRTKSHIIAVHDQL